MKRISNTKKDISLNLAKKTGFSYLLSCKLTNDLLETIISEIKNHKLMECEKPKASIPPWLLTTGPFNPKKIAPLYFLGSSFSLNFFKAK